MTRNDWLTDKRIVRRNIEQGRLDAAEYEKLLESLPDLSDKVWRRPEGAAAVVQTVRKSIAPAPTPAARPFDYLAAPLGASPAAAAPATFAAGSDDDEDDDDLDDDEDDDLDDDADDADDADEADGDEPVRAAPPQEAARIEAAPVGEEGSDDSDEDDDSDDEDDDEDDEDDDSDDDEVVAP